VKDYLYLIATDRAKGPMAFLVKGIMRALSWVFWLLIILRAWLYRANLISSYRLSRPVISVGNLTLGGVGKTPLVEYLAEAVKQMDRKPVILTRGYMERGKETKDQNSDEALMLQDALVDVPVLVGADRVKNATTFLEHNDADVFILDDGFQHHRLKRDHNIVVIDATDPWGNGYLLPRGVLREPRSSLARAQSIVITKADLGKDNLAAVKNQIRIINGDCLVMESIHRPVEYLDVRTDNVLKIDALRGQRICAVSSIGAPESFAMTLMGLGADLRKHFAYPDHYQYAEEDMHKIFMNCQDERATALVTTHKDIVKIKHFCELVPKQIILLMLKIRIDITENEEAFLERIHNLL